MKTGLQPRRILPALLGMLAALGACDDDAGPASGKELGPCVDGFCEAPLVCAPEDICVDPAQLSGGSESAGTGAPTSTSSDHVPDEDAAGGEEGDPGGDESSESDGTTGHDSEAEGGQEGGTDGDSGNGTDGESDSGDDVPAACVQYANAYCGCIADVATPDCIPNVTDDCAWVYDLCPAMWSCINAHTSSCDLDAAADCTCD